MSAETTDLKPPPVVVRLIDKATLETRQAAIARVKRSGIFAWKGKPHDWRRGQMPRLTE